MKYRCVGLDSDNRDARGCESQMRMVENNATIMCEVSQIRTKKTKMRPNHGIECETVEQRCRRLADMDMEWMVVSKPAETPFKNGGGETVFAERTVERVPTTLETPLGTLGSRGTRGMGKECKDIATRISP